MFTVQFCSHEPDSCYFQSNDVIISQELDTLEAVWNLALEWDNMYDEWKTTTFVGINTIEMEYESQNIFKKAVKFHRDLRVSLVDQETMWEMF